MKVVAHVVVAKGYSIAIKASQWVDELQQHCEECNQEAFGDRYLSEDRERAVVTVTFEVPEHVFKRQTVAEIKGEI